jgi:predicted nucleotidyltransferase
MPEGSEDILRIARQHGVGHVRAFGSHARRTAGESSDVDLLIEVNGPPLRGFLVGSWPTSRPSSAAVWT